MIERRELLALTRFRGQFMRIIALFAPPTYVLTRFGVIISCQDVSIGISLQVASGRPETHLLFTQSAGALYHPALPISSAPPPRLKRRRQFGVPEHVVAGDFYYTPALVYLRVL